MADTLHRATIAVETGQATASIDRIAHSVQQMAAAVIAIASKLGADLSGVAQVAFQATQQSAEGASEATGQAIEGASARGRGALESLGESAGSNGGRIQRSLDTITLSALLDQISRVASGLDSLAGAGMQFEQSMADLSAITGVVGDELKALGDTARAVGKESGLGAAESARAFTILASQIQVPVEQLKVLQDQTILLSQSGGLSLEESANALAGTINQFKLSADQAERVTNVLAAGARAGAAEVNDLADSFKVVGATASGYGVSVEETASAIEILSKSNIKGAEAGTAMRNVLSALQTKLKINVAETGLGGGLQQVKTYLDAIESPTDRATQMLKIFGRESMTAAQFLLSNTEALDKMTVAVTGTNEAEAQAATRTSTMAHWIKKLHAKVEDFKIGLNEATGGALLPMTAGLAGQAVQLSQMLPLLHLMRTGLLNLANVQKIAAVAQRALNFALSANPIGIVVMAIAALVAGIIYAYKHCEDFRNGVDKVWGVVKALALLLWEKLKPAFDMIAEAFQWLWPWLKKLGGAIVDFLLLPFKLLGKALEWVADKLRDWFGLNLNMSGSPLAEEVGEQNEQIDEQTKKVGELTKALEELQLQKDNLAATGVDTASISNQIVALENALAIARGEKKAVAGDPITFEGSDQEDKKIRNLYSIEGISNIINDLQEKAAKSTEREAVALMKKADELEKIKKAMETRITHAAGEETHLARIEVIKERITSLQALIQRSSKEAGKSFSQELDKLQKELLALRAKVKAPIITPIILAKPLYKEDIEEMIGKAKKESTSKKLFGIEVEFDNKGAGKRRGEEFKEKQDRWKAYVRDIQSGVGAIGEAMGNIGKIIGGAAGEWLQWGASVIGAIGQALPALLALFNAQTAVAGSGAASSKAAIPIVGPVLAVAAVASVLASISAIPKATAFAAGGIVSAPTYALVGEYAGASNNPEVIAPLNKLRDLIRPAGGESRALDAHVEFKIRGRDLIGIIRRENHINKLS